MVTALGRRRVRGHPARFLLEPQRHTTAGRAAVSVHGSYWESLSQQTRPSALGAGREAAWATSVSFPWRRLCLLCGFRGRRRQLLRHRPGRGGRKYRPAGSGTQVRRPVRQDARAPTGWGPEKPPLRGHGSHMLAAGAVRSPRKAQNSIGARWERGAGWRCPPAALGAVRGSPGRAPPRSVAEVCRVSLAALGEGPLASVGVALSPRVGDPPLYRAAVLQSPATGSARVPQGEMHQVHVLRWGRRAWVESARCFGGLWPWGADGTYP